MVAEPSGDRRRRGGDDDLAAYADHDLIGREPPNSLSAPNEAAVRADAGELSEIGRPRPRARPPRRTCVRQRGLLDDPNPMQPLDARAQRWAAEDPGRRRVTFVPDVNHYTITLGAEGGGRGGALSDALAEG